MKDSFPFQYLNSGNCFDGVLGVIFEDTNLKRRQSSIRNDLIANSLSIKRHLYSVFNYSSVTNIVSFWMPEEEFKKMTTKPNYWYATLIRTDSWVSLSNPVHLSKAKLSEIQLN